MPIGTERFNNALLEAFELTKGYTREHVLLCLVPPFFIAGVIAVFISQGAVIKYFGAFMYFATLTEIPIIQGLLNNGMGQGPALALLLAGPALSLPNMLVIRSVIGTQKITVYVILVSVMATISGLIYGSLY